MKAKDMAQRWRASDNPQQSAVDLLRDLIQDTGELGKRRHAQSREALVAVFKQGEETWKAFCRLCPAVNPTTYKFAIHQVHPELKSWWP